MKSSLRYLNHSAVTTIAGAVLLSLLVALPRCVAVAAEVPLVRIAHGAFNEKILALWIAKEQGFFRKQGVNVEIINIRTGGQTIAAIASGDVQIAYTIPGSVLSGAVGGIDVVFFGGLVNRPDGDFVVAPGIKRAEDLKGKRVGVQSIGGGIWSLSMLALEYMGLEPTREPYIRAHILIPERFVGAVMKLCLERRGVNSSFNYPSPGRVEISFEMPLSEVIIDFYDRLKTITQGYGSFDYELLDYRPSELVKLDILVNSEKVDALSMIVHRDKAREWGVRVCDRLRDEIPKQQFKIAIQGAIGGQIISRSTISAFRKDVTAKCYGGDITRKRKLLEKQRAGKKRMKMVGAVEIPQSAFVAVLKTEGE